MTNNSNWADPQNWTTAVVAFTPNAGDKQYEGKNLQEISELRKQDPVETTLDLLLENNGMVNMVYFGMNEDDVKEAMRQPWVSVGSDGSALQPEGVLGEGKPHPRNYGTFTRVLQKYVHDEKVITLEDAVRKMTSLAADQLHLRDRGLLRVGMYADVVVFDPNKVVERATFTQPHQFSEGMQYVVVNGKLVIDGGQHTGAHPGRVTVFIPHFAMSGGTLVALGADEIVMTKHAMLGPIDPQINCMPAVSIIKVATEKPLSEIDDQTLIFADVGQKAIEQLRRQATELLRAPMTPDAAKALAEQLTSGRWTHDYPITVSEARALGLPVNTDMPDDVLDLMMLFPQPVRTTQGVEFGPRRAAP